MNRYVSSTLFIVAFFTAFWAYSIIDTLIREFSGQVTFIDLAVLFILGLIAGIAIGILIARIKQKTAG